MGSGCGNKVKIRIAPNGQVVYPCSDSFPSTSRSIISPRVGTVSPSLFPSAAHLSGWLVSFHVMFVFIYLSVIPYTGVGEGIRPNLGGEGTSGVPSGSRQLGVPGCAAAHPLEAPTLHVLHSSTVSSRYFSNLLFTRSLNLVRCLHPRSFLSFSGSSFYLVFWLTHEQL